MRTVEICWLIGLGMPFYLYIVTRIVTKAIIRTIEERKKEK